LVGLPQVCEISFLSLLPVGLTLASRRVGEAIRAGLDDSGYPLTEPVLDVFQPCLAALIFNTIVQKSGLVRSGSTMLSPKVLRFAAERKAAGMQRNSAQMAQGERPKSNTLSQDLARLRSAN
jgi:hypothetical protein